MKKFLFLSSILLSLVFACQQRETLPDTLPMQVAKAYGFENWDQIKSIGYTWNVQRDSATVVSRTWKWNIQDSTVSYAGADTSFTYSLVADSLPKQDGAFINDKYWAMMPFQLAWDKGYTYEVLENATSPIQGLPSTKLSILYGADGGYTPGDAYDLYLDAEHKILEWTFRKGNAPEGRTWTWEKAVPYGPIQISLEHKDPEGKRFIWLTDVTIN
jgi:hypothetical protein